MTSRTASRSAPEPVRDFLAQKRIAVAGVSRDPRGAANLIFRTLRDSGRDVIPINPRAAAVEGVACYPSLLAAPGPIDGVVIATRPEVSLEVVRQCADAKIPRVWMHRSIGAGSVSDEAVAHCRQHGICVIAGGCPMMYCEPVDVGHRCIRWLLGAMGKLPR
jgi:predicted CoA-binding protein